MENGSEKESTKDNSEIRIEQFKFTGQGGEYFGIWIVNILLTIVTVGIYSAWAKVRNKQYFYGNTFLNDSSFTYTAQPMQILKGRIIAVLAFITYNIVSTYQPTIGLVLGLILVALAPWVIMKSLAFNARYSEYRNIRFSFHQHLPEAVKVLLVIPLMMFFPFILLGIYAAYSGDTPTVGGDQNDLSGGLFAAIAVASILAFLAYPYVLYRSSRYIIDNHRLGSAEFNLGLKGPKPVYQIYFEALFLLICLGLAFALLALLLSTMGLSNFDSDDGNFFLALIFGLALIIPYIGMYILVYAYVRAKTYNLYYKNATIEQHKLDADMTTSGLAWIYFTNSLGIIFTVGIFIPWAMVRSANYRANHTSLLVHGNLNDFVGQQEQNQAAFGEELGEVFDLDIGI